MPVLQAKPFATSEISCISELLHGVPERHLHKMARYLLMAGTALTLGMLFPTSASAQSDPSFGRTILECPPPKTVVGDFLAEIRAAEALHDTRYTGSDTPNRYSTLERRVIKILKSLRAGPCGSQLLGALLDDEGNPPPPLMGGDPHLSVRYCNNSCGIQSECGV